jgi:hypothetical protein
MVLSDKKPACDRLGKYYSTFTRIVNTIQSFTPSVNESKIASTEPD